MLHTLHTQHKRSVNKSPFAMGDDDADELHLAKELESAGHPTSDVSGRFYLGLCLDECRLTVCLRNAQLLRDVGDLVALSPHLLDAANLPFADVAATLLAPLGKWLSDG